ncbi:hypothetical protein [Paenibacillus sp. W2I17]|nr:hypothetical protein [Paenibacillus sp. W2I17]MDQ0655977.1 hypothetical protein [Paenibacillus sp. W2I17]
MKALIFLGYEGAGVVEKTDVDGYVKDFDWWRSLEFPYFEKESR